ncbi:MAG: M23 family metallopeptidase [Gemmatimonadota bacterium]|nr:M23 family metallopeptidase [Gemmatimonadota bacterium]
MKAGTALIAGLIGVTVLAGTGLVRSARTAPDAGMIPALDAEPPLDLDVRTLARGQTLGQVLESAAIPLAEQQALLMAFREQASPRRMRDGTEVTFQRHVRDGSLRAVDIALSPDETVHLVREDVGGWRSQIVETPVWMDTVYVAGEIKDVLWNAVTGNPGLASMTVGDRALLIHKLDQIFQWQVDFSRQIREGDFFRFAFERQVRPDGSMREGHVLAAELVNQGTPLQAIWFDPSGDGQGSYYDAEGKSVRRAFLLKPLAYSRISSRFTLSRFHPVLKTWRAHVGVDYAAASGTPIMATADGIVVHRGRRGNYGNAVEIQHANGFLSRYAHLSGFAPGIKVGDRVRQEDIIGFVGMTGLASGPHLHYELRRRGGAPIDPLSVDLPQGDPVPAEAADVWNVHLASSMGLLERLPSQPATTVAALTSADLDESGRVRPASATASSEPPTR